MSDLEKAIEIVAAVGRLRGQYDAVCAECDALKAELKDCKNVISLVHPDYSRFVMRALDAEKDRDHWKSLALKAREALEKISNDLYRYEDRGEDVARYDSSPMALLAKEALSLFPKEPSDK